MFGTQHRPAYCGIGGITIGALPEALRTAADLQACGDLWFAVAPWNTCGVGGMPSCASDPQKLLAHNSLRFAVAQLESVMACVVLGWAFTALGRWRAARARESSRSEIEL